MLHDLVDSITPITKLQTALMVLLSFLVYSSVLSKYDLYFNAEKIFAEGQVRAIVVAVLAVSHQRLLRGRIRHRRGCAHHNLVSQPLL